MGVCDDNDEDLEVKQEPIDSDTVKSEEFTPGLESEDSTSDSRDALVDGQFQKYTGSGKEWNGEHNQFLFSAVLDHVDLTVSAELMPWHMRQSIHRANLSLSDTYVTHKWLTFDLVVFSHCVGIWLTFLKLKPVTRGLLPIE